MGFINDVLGRNDRKDARRLAAEGRLQPFSFLGPGGMSASFDAETGATEVGAGDLGFLRNQLFNSVAGGLMQGQQGPMGNLPGWLQGAAAGAGTDLARNQALEQAFGFAGDQQMASAFGGAATNALNIANQDPTAIAQDRLNLLREQAQPFEREQFQDLTQGLFSRGRLGATGGAKQTEAFARGLGQADLQRQMSAFDFARQYQQDATNRALGFGGMEQDILTGSLGRQLGISGDVQQRARDRFNIANQLFNTGQGAQQNQLANALSALGGIQGIDNTALQGFQAALNAAVARSNAALGGSSNLASLGANPIVSGSDIADFAGSALTQI